MNRPAIAIAVLALSAGANVLHTANSYSHEPEDTRDSMAQSISASSYENALRVWKSPEDINGWIFANFSYDTSRATRLSETQRSENESIAIYSPSKLFDTKTGVCVDLSRFSFETLMRINPHSDPKYLMIEFEPIRIRGDTFRLHWLVSFRRDGKVYVFSDSNRPGHIAGPYDDVQAFAEEYEQYRDRKIVAFRELESYQKQQQARVVKHPATGMP